jgi:hypothetical protein
MTDQPDYRAHLHRRLDASGVPASLHNGLVEYFAARRPTGSFLRACLANDFSQACLRADPDNRFYFVEIARFLIFYVPSTAWGSTEAVDAWLADPEPVPEPFE